MNTREQEIADANNIAMFEVNHGPMYKMSMERLADVFHQERWTQAVRNAARLEYDAKSDHGAR